MHVQIPQATDRRGHRRDLLERLGVQVARDNGRHLRRIDALFLVERVELAHELGDLP